MHSAKIFMKGKPIKFGYKFWCLCSEDRYLYNFAPYLGKENDPNNESLGIRVIKNLTSIIPKEEATNHKIFFDNFYTSIEVLKHLGDNSLKATGTIRENRTKKCLLISSKVMKKATERGFTDYRFDRETRILVVKWHDNTPVSIATNYSFVYPVGNTTRHLHKLKKKITIKIPKVVSEYNKSMGGVDLLDKQVTLYRTRIHGKKWWFPIFNQMLDVAVVNCWRIHNIVNKDENLTLLETRRRLTLPLLSKTSSSNRHRPKPQRSILRRERVSEEVRYDSGNHFVAVIQT